MFKSELICSRHTQLENFKATGEAVSDNFRQEQTTGEKVKRFLTILGKNRLLVKENDFLDTMKCFSEQRPALPTTDEHCKAADLGPSK